MSTRRKFENDSCHFRTRLARLYGEQMKQVLEHLNKNP